MKKETKVMRLTEKEIKLIKHIRENGEKQLIGEVKLVLDDVKDRNKYASLKSILSILNHETINRESLINFDFIKEEDFNFLEEVINSNKNIIILGMPNCGKGILMKTLLPYYNGRLLIVDKSNEINLNESIINEKLVVSTTKTLNMNELSVLKKECGRIAISEIYDIEDALSMLSSLSLGNKIITTAQYSENWKNEFVEMFDDSLKNSARDIINKNEFVEVYLCKTEDRECFRKVKMIIKN